MNKRFVIGVDRAKMKLYDLEPSAQKDISDSGQRQDDQKPKWNGGGGQSNQKQFGQPTRDFSKIRV
jgi:hypothetical protein